MTALALALTLVMALPPAASDAVSYQVQIHPNGHTSIPTQNDALATRFQAYQIFAGDIDGDDEGKKDGVITASPQIGGLSNVEWGKGVETSKLGALLYALTQIKKPIDDVNVNRDRLLSVAEPALYYGAYGADTIVDEAEKELADLDGKSPDEVSDPPTYCTFNEENAEWEIDQGRLRSLIEQALDAAIGALTLGKLFQAALESKDYGYKVENGSVTPPTSGDFTKSAQVVSTVLSDFTSVATGNAALAKALSEVLPAYLAAAPTASSKWFGDYGDPNGYWAIGEVSASGTNSLQAGYYLILDDNNNKEQPEGTADSEVVMGVFSNQSIYVKSYAPTVEKAIINRDNGNSCGDDFQFGDTDEIITFRITGTLPENLSNYEKYHYTFTDKLHESLSYVDQSLNVYAVNGSAIYLLDLSDDSKIAFSESAGTITVGFDNLKDVDSGIRVAAVGDTAGSSGKFTITKDWKIVLQYNAKLNNRASIDKLISESGNTVTLTYSSSLSTPDKTNHTVEFKNYIYDFGVDILLYDGTEPEEPEEEEPEEPKEEESEEEESEEEEPGEPKEEEPDDAGDNPGARIADGDDSDSGTTGGDGSDSGTPEEPAPAENVPLPEAGFTLSRVSKRNNRATTYYAFSNGAADGNVAWLSLADIRAYSGSSVPTIEADLNRYAIGRMNANYNGHLSEFSLSGWAPVRRDGKLVSETRFVSYSEGLTEYAVFEKGPDGGYYLYDWIREADLRNYLGGSIKWENISGGKLGPKKAGTADDYTDKYIYLTTDEKGSLHMEGLSAGKYILDEVIVPGDFEKLKNKELELFAEYYSPTLTEAAHLDGTIKNLYYSFDGKYTYVVRDGKFCEIDEDNLFDTLAARLILINKPGMPDTGGVGTALFYIGGSALLAGAAAILIVSNAKKKQKEGKRVRHTTGQK